MAYFFYLITIERCTHTAYESHYQICTPFVHELNWELAGWISANSDLHTMPPS